MQLRLRVSLFEQKSLIHPILVLNLNLDLNLLLTLHLTLSSYYTVSINVFSTWLKSRRPTNKNKAIHSALYPNDDQSKEPALNNANRKPSRIEVSGFIFMIQKYLLL